MLGRFKSLILLQIVFHLLSKVGKSKPNAGDHRHRQSGRFFPSIFCLSVGEVWWVVGWSMPKMSKGSSDGDGESIIFTRSETVCYSEAIYRTCSPPSLSPCFFTYWPALLLLQYLIYLYVKGEIEETHTLTHTLTDIERPRQRGEAGQ